MEKAVFGIAKTEDQAVNIANQLKAAGFSESDISVLFPDKTGTRDFAHEQHTKAPEGAATGAGTGAVLGGALGWMVGIGALAIPGLGVTGAFVGMGIPELEAKQYEGKIRGGNILMSVHAVDGNEVSRAKEILKNGGASDISYTGEKAVSSSARP
jgi:hypothetical protein